MGRTNDNLCTVTTLLSYLIHHGDAPGPLFQWDNHTPLSKSKFVDHVLMHCQQPMYLHILTLDTAPALEQQQQQQPQLVQRTLQFKLWDVGKAHPISSTLAEPISSGKLIHHHGIVPYLTVTDIYLFVPIIIVLHSYLLTYIQIAIHCLSGCKQL